MFRKYKVLTPERLVDSDVHCALLLCAMRAFREAEAQAGQDASREGRLLAEFAELVVLPGSKSR